MTGVIHYETAAERDITDRSERVCKIGRGERERFDMQITWRKRNEMLPPPPQALEFKNDFNDF